LDEAEHNHGPVESEVAAALLARVRGMLTLMPPTTNFATRYLEMLQRHPDVVFAHRDLVAELPKGFLGPPPSMLS